MKLTEVYWKNVNAYKDPNIRIIANKGSTRSSKTYSILQMLYMIAKYSPDALLISVVSESIPHLKRGAIRDFEAILRDENILVDEIRNKTDNVYKIGNSQIEFFGADSDGKIHGPARDILFINECNNVRYEAYRQLAIRTRGKIFLDFNPVKRFYVDKVLSLRSDFTLIHSTYKMNNYLTKEQVSEIESNKHDTNWWNVYGLGITGGTEGLVYPEYEIIKEMPKDFRRRMLGIDFGFTSDPTAVVDCGIIGDGLYIDEVCYKTGMLNDDIAREIKEADLHRINAVADSAEQKSIKDLRRYGIRCFPCVKGKGSIAGGISKVKKFKLYVTERSVNVIDELDNYSWKKDRDGVYLNEPEDKHNHAMDAVRYSLDYMDRGGSGATITTA